MIAYSVAAVIASFAFTMLGGLLAIRYRNLAVTFSAFAGGVLIAIAAVDVLPETINMATISSVPIAAVAVIALSGFVFLLVLSRREDWGAASPTGKGRTTGIFAGLEMIGHSLLEGLAIAVAFEIGVSVGLVVALAVIVHDSSDGLTLTTMLIRSGQSVRTTWIMLLAEGIAPAIGVSLTIAFDVPASFVALLLAFIAGGFLYVGALEMLPHAVRSSTGLAYPALVGAVGFSAICLVSVVL